MVRIISILCHSCPRNCKRMLNIWCSDDSLQVTVKYFFMGRPIFRLPRARDLLLRLYTLSGRDGPWGDLFDEWTKLIPDQTGNNMFYFHIILPECHDEMSSIVMRLSREINNDQTLKRWHQRDNDNVFCFYLCLLQIFTSGADRRGTLPDQ